MPTARHGRSRPSRRSSRCTPGRQVRDETMGIRRPDGTFTWLRVNAYPIHDDDGVVDGATTIFNDITDIFERATSQQASATSIPHHVRAFAGRQPHRRPGRDAPRGQPRVRDARRAHRRRARRDRPVRARRTGHLDAPVQRPHVAGAQRHERRVVRVPTSRRRGPLRPDPDLRDRMAGLRPVLDGPSRRHHRAGTVADRARAQRQPLPGDVRFVTDRADDLRARRCRQACQPGDGPAPRPARPRRSPGCRSTTSSTPRNSSA